MRVGVARRRQPRPTTRAVRAGLRPVARGRRGSDWIACEREFQQANLEAIREVPDHAVSRPLAAALGSVSRAYYDAETADALRRLQLPGRRRARRRHLARRRRGRARSVDIKGPRIYTVTSLAYDPDAPDALLHDRQQRLSRPRLASIRETGQARTLLRDARIGDLAFNRADRSLWGVRHLNGLATLVRIPPPYPDWKQVHTCRTARSIYDLDVSPDGRSSSRLVRRDHRPADAARARRPRRCSRATRRRSRASTSAVACRPTSSSRPTAKYLYGSSYYTGVSNIFRYDLATGKLEAVSNTETGFFRPVPLGGDSLVVFRYTGRASCRPASRRGRSRTSARSRSSANGSSRSTRS